MPDYEQHHYDIVEWLCNNRTEGCTQRAIEVATRRAPLKIVQLLYKTRRNTQRNTPQQYINF